MPRPTPSPWTPPHPLPQEFETNRLRLRYWRPEDAASMLEAIDADRASFLPWLPWVEVDNRTVEECLAAVERMRCGRERTEPVADDFVLGIFDRTSGRVLGGTGLHRLVRTAHEGEIGYWVRPDERGRGICTEAVAGLLSWAFTSQQAGGWGLRRIHIRCAAGNLASQRVPRKLGLREEARLVQERWVAGRGWDDTLVWGVLREEWDVGRAALLK